MNPIDFTQYLGVSYPHLGFDVGIGMRFGGCTAAEN